MKKIQKVWFALVSLLVVVSLIGCGPKATAPVEQPTAVVVQPTAVVAQPTATVDPTACNLDAPSTPVVINMIGWSFPITDFYASELEKCNQVENLTVNTQQLDSASAHEQMRLGLGGGGKAPWAIIHNTAQDVAEFASAGWLYPLDDLVEKYWTEYKLDDIPEAAWTAVTYEGHIYGVPWDANTIMMFYNMDLFAKYNITPPTTYDEVIAACKILKNEPSLSVPFTMNLHAGWAWEIEFFNFIGSFGGKYFNPDNTPAFNSPEGVAALTKMKEVVDACMGPQGLTYSIDDSEIGMENGTIGFVNIWASRAANMDNPEKSNFVGRIGFAPAAAPNPAGKLGGPSYYDAYCIPANPDVDPDLVFRVIMEATDFQSQLEASQLGIIVRTSVAAAGGGGSRYLGAVNETLAKGVGAPPSNPALPLMIAALGNWLPLVGTGEKTPAEALQAAADEYLAQATQQGFVK
ncbi:MAG: extracellular solute-binding protein [Chloroflexi bacterium]|nr:extracellular solute-binding protein [Chloroflexota bacterium]